MNCDHMPNTASLPASVAVRLKALRLRINHAADHYKVCASDAVFFGAMVRMLSIVVTFIALAVVEKSPHGAWWVMLLVFALLLLESEFKPAAQALRYARQENALRALAQDMQAIGPLTDSDVLMKYESKVTQLIARF